MIFVNGSGGSDANDGSSWVQALATVTAGFTVTGGNADGSGGGRTDRGGGVFAAETSPTVRACVLSADPLFYNTDTHNYRLASGSPCIDVGTTTAQTLLDLDGNARLDIALVTNGTGSPVYADIGAYEYGY